MSATLRELAEKVERVSQIYAERCDIHRDEDWFALKIQEEAGELISEYLRSSGRGRVGGSSAEALRVALENEAADLLAQLLLFCRHNRVDIEGALERKWFSHLEPTSTGQ
jgi:NTP pyrophosphatase (non-canonical NTP hydrolase)